MPLLDVQMRLAAILLEPKARAAFAKDPAGHLEAQGLGGADARLLAGLVPDDVAYFAERRNIDRHQALRADAPRTVAMLEAALGRLNAYFRERPYAEEDPRDEAKALAAWTKKAARAGTIPRHIPDMAAFEAATLHLSTKAARAPSPSAVPRQAPGMRLLALRHDVVQMLRFPDNDPVARPTWMALLRTPDDVRWIRLDEADHRLLRLATGRRPWGDWLRESGLAASEARLRADELVADGLLAPRRTSR